VYVVQIKGSFESSRPEGRWLHPCTTALRCRGSVAEAIHIPQVYQGISVSQRAYWFCFESHIASFQESKSRQSPDWTALPLIRLSLRWLPACPALSRFARSECGRLEGSHTTRLTVPTSYLVLAPVADVAFRATALALVVSPLALLAEVLRPSFASAFACLAHKSYPRWLLAHTYYPPKINAS